jgi:hypothetical protein
MATLSTRRPLYAWLQPRNERSGKRSVVESKHPPGEEMIDAAAYRAYVQQAADGNKPSEILVNRSAHHAAIVMEVLFSKAHREVRILTKALSEDVYATPSTLRAAIRFLQQNGDGKIEILTEQPIDRASHGFLRELDHQGCGGRVKVWAVPPNAQKMYRFNFAVVDGLHFRFESDRDNREAIVQFGETAFAGHLDRIFGTIRESVAVQGP